MVSGKDLLETKQKRARASCTERNYHLEQPRQDGTFLRAGRELECDASSRGQGYRREGFLRAGGAREAKGDARMPRYKSSTTSH